MHPLSNCNQYSVTKASKQVYFVTQCNCIKMSSFVIHYSLPVKPCIIYTYEITITRPRPSQNFKRCSSEQVDYVGPANWYTTCADLDVVSL